MSGKKGKVVVFGGSGFVGSHVADALTAAGYRTVIFDQKRSQYLSSDQEMIVGDIMDLPSVIAAAKGARYVYNFAGLADLDEAKDKPVDSARLNVLGNVHTLEAAYRAKAKRFVYASTVYVYSDTGAFYRASKQSSEHFVESYHERCGLDYTILRYGSLYGRRSGERNGIYLLLRQAIEKNSITYEGNGEALRDYIHVADAARLSVQILMDEYANRHIVLAGQERWKVRDLMKMIAEMVGQRGNKVRLKFGDSSVDGHYTMTPYAFSPRLGHKLVSSEFVDLGQGLLDCLDEIYGEVKGAGS